MHKLLTQRPMFRSQKKITQQHNRNLTTYNLILVSQPSRKNSLLIKLWSVNYSQIKNSNKIISRYSKTFKTRTSSSALTKLSMSSIALSRQVSPQLTKSSKSFHSSELKNSTKCLIKVQNSFHQKVKLLLLTFKQSNPNYINNSYYTNKISNHFLILKFKKFSMIKN